MASEPSERGDPPPAEPDELADPPAVEPLGSEPAGSQPLGTETAPGTLAALAAALASPGALFRMPRRAWAYFVLYLLSCSALLGLTAWQLAAHEGELTSLALGYLLPESWHFAADLLVEHMLAAQHRLILINALVTTALMAVTVLLFPVKELLSAAYERDGRLLPGEVMREHPLWLQGWQEIKLLMLFVAVQGTIFWLGYLPHRGTTTAAVILGLLFLWFSFAIDFISPIFQRHEGYYSQIIKCLVRYAPAALLFGLIFCAPTFIVGKLWEQNPAWSWTTALFLLFGVNVLCIAWAAGSGTWLGSFLHPGFTARRRSHIAGRISTWAVLLAVLAANGYTFGALALSIHHKSQILKCDYSIDLDSLGVDAPDVFAILDDRLEVAVHVDLRIHNPTDFDVEIEDNDVRIEHRGSHVATTRLAPMLAPAGQTVRQTLRFSMQATPSMIARGRSLLDSDAWTITLHVQVAPYFRLPVYLL